MSHVSRLDIAQSERAPAADRRGLTSRAWAAAYARLGALEYSDDGRSILAPLAPALLTAWDEREADAVAASVAFVAGEATQTRFAAALAAWEAAVCEAIKYLARVCHGCGRTEAAVMVATVSAGRYCRRCLQDGMGCRRRREP